MRTYYITSQPDVFFDPSRGISFGKGTPAYAAMRAEIAKGTAKLDPWPSKTYRDGRLSAYKYAGLTFDAWMEAVVETLGASGPQGTKFAALWAKREEIRAVHPKS